MPLAAEWLGARVGYGFEVFLPAYLQPAYHFIKDAFQKI
jgi:hypothetical protein